MGAGALVEASLGRHRGWSAPTKVGVYQGRGRAPARVGIYQGRSRAPTKVGIYQSKRAQPPLQSCDSRASMPRCSLLIAVRSLCSALL